MQWTFQRQGHETEWNVKETDNIQYSLWLIFFLLLIFIIINFRSGVQTLPLNAKVHYNYANFLKDQGRNREAIYHYRTALK